AVFGNHDDEGALKRRALYDLQKTFPGCRTEAGPETLPGIGTYVLSVGARNGGGAGALLYFIDSGSYAPKPAGSKDTAYAWIAPEQIAWYLERAATLSAGQSAPLPALAFFHIPVPEYDTVWETRPCRGVKYEAVCCPKHNSGFFAALRRGGDVLGTFVGHDHINDYDGELDGIRLCYGRGTGHNTYGKDGFPRGARLIRLREGVRAFESWLRLDAGAVVTEQPLHAPAGAVLSV
ncbi:MAG: metallophosphoesterase family protein, partial [bacterium]